MTTSVRPNFNGQPSRKRWETVVREEAEKLGVDPVAVINKRRGRTKPISLARWRAWKRLHDMGRYSISAIAFVGGYDHTTVLHAMKRLPVVEAANAGMAVAA